MHDVIARRGLTDAIEVLPWLPDEAFRSVFASASLVVFPSEFEGFGLPAAEAMRLGIPLVISPEPALLEITAGHATVMENDTVEALVDAVAAARLTTPEERASATEHAARFTWSNFAWDVRSLLHRAVVSRQERRRRVFAPAWTSSGAPAMDASPETILSVGSIAGPSAATSRLRRPSVRLVAALSTAVLALTGLSAASFALVASHPRPAGSLATTTTVAKTRVPAATAGTPNRQAGARPSKLPSPSHLPKSGRRSGSATAPSDSTLSTLLPETTLPVVTLPPVTVPPTTLPPSVTSPVSCLETTTVPVPGCSAASTLPACTCVP